MELGGGSWLTTDLMEHQEDKGEEKKQENKKTGWRRLKKVNEKIKDKKTRWRTGRRIRVEKEKEKKNKTSKKVMKATLEPGSFCRSASWSQSRRRPLQTG